MWSLQRKNNNLGIASIMPPKNETKLEVTIQLSLAHDGGVELRDLHNI